MAPARIKIKKRQENRRRGQQRAFSRKWRQQSHMIPLHQQRGADIPETQGGKIKECRFLQSYSWGSIRRACSRPLTAIIRKLLLHALRDQRRNALHRTSDLSLTSTKAKAAKHVPAQLRTICHFFTLSAQFLAQICLSIKIAQFARCSTLLV